MSIGWCELHSCLAQAQVGVGAMIWRDRPIITAGGSWGECRLPELPTTAFNYLTSILQKNLRYILQKKSYVYPTKKS